MNKIRVRDTLKEFHTYEGDVKLQITDQGIEIFEFYKSPLGQSMRRTLGHHPAGTYLWVKEEQIAPKAESAFRDPFTERALGQRDPNDYVNFDSFLPRVDKEHNERMRIIAEQREKFINATEVSQKLKEDSMLVVTRGDGVPLPDQKAALKEFKAQSGINIQAYDGELEKLADLTGAVDEEPTPSLDDLKARGLIKQGLNEEAFEQPLTDLAGLTAGPAKEVDIDATIKAAETRHKKRKPEKAESELPIEQGETA